MKFRLRVHKMKCLHCDLIFLVEDSKFYAPDFVCPCCDDSQGNNVEHMGNITVVQE